MKSYYDPNAVVKATVNIFFSVNRQQLQFSTLYKQSQSILQLHHPQKQRNSGSY